MRIAFGTAIILSALAGVALAKLPPPTPEQEQTAAAKKQVEQAQADQAKEALDRVQNRIADNYKRSKGSSGGSATTTVSTKSETTNMSKGATESKGSAGPQGGTRQSAEAHSAPAK